MDSDHDRHLVPGLVVLVHTEEPVSILVIGSGSRQQFLVVESRKKKRREAPVLTDPGRLTTSEMLRRLHWLS